jgi:hypothetical protein
LDAEVDTLIHDHIRAGRPGGVCHARGVWGGSLEENLSPEKSGSRKIAQSAEWICTEPRLQGWP